MTFCAFFHSNRAVLRSACPDCAINQHPARVGLQSPGATDIMRPARLTTLSMGALLVLPQRYSVYQVRSGRKQPRQMTCVPGCSWQGPHPFLALAATTCCRFSPSEYPSLPFHGYDAKYLFLRHRFIYFISSFKFHLTVIVLSSYCHNRPANISFLKRLFIRKSLALDLNNQLRY